MSPQRNCFGVQHFRQFATTGSTVSEDVTEHRFTLEITDEDPTVDTDVM
ncbi:MAG: hypothetical protein IPI91_13150 [Flavobacteriales bacterium]|nr:hypothetical protein [Flavobacteriales bacterium]